MYYIMNFAIDEQNGPKMQKWEPSESSGKPGDLSARYSESGVGCRQVIFLAAANYMDIEQCVSLLCTAEELDI
jgi:hypothetical protein